MKRANTDEGVGLPRRRSARKIPKGEFRCIGFVYSSDDDSNLGLGHDEDDIPCSGRPAPPRRQSSGGRTRKQQQLDSTDSPPLSGFASKRRRVSGRHQSSQGANSRRHSSEGVLSIDGAGSSTGGLSSLDDSFDFPSDLFDNDILPNSHGQRHDRSKLEPAPAPAPTALPYPQYTSEPFVPAEVMALLHEHRGICSLFEWQRKCLERLKASAQAGRNFVYTVPTSGGKTLVAEICMLDVLRDGQSVVFLLPYKSIVHEKAAELAPFAAALGFYVEVYAAHQGRFPPQQRRKRRPTLFIATLEKGDALLDYFAERRTEGKPVPKHSTVGLIVVDELHMLGESDRGARLEFCLSKLMFYAKTVGRAANTPPRIIGMSATLSNLADICEFLGADTYCGNFRPVELLEYLCVVKSGQPSQVFKVSSTQQLDPAPLSTLFPAQTNPEHADFMSLVEASLDAPVLVFCATKKSCNSLAKTLAKLLQSRPPPTNTAALANQRRALWHDLNDDGRPAELDHSMVALGIACHHTDFSERQRALIEQAFAGGTLHILFCTSTLAAGVNLPAARVIIRSPLNGARKSISLVQYKQMIGRAGRTGLSTAGNSVLVVSNEEESQHAVNLLLGTEYDTVVSQLVGSDSLYTNSNLARCILSLLVSKTVTQEEQLNDFCRVTLYGRQNSASNLASKLHRCLNDELVAAKLLVKDAEGGFTVTGLGRAMHRANFDVGMELGEAFRDHLVKELQKVNVVSQLHLLYLITPMDNNFEVSLRAMLQKIESLEPKDKRVAEALALSDKQISIRIKRSNAPKKYDRHDSWTRLCCGDDPDAVCRKFFGTLVLFDSIRNDGQGGALCGTLSAGIVQEFRARAASFARQVSFFAAEIPELRALPGLIDELVKPILHGTTMELAPLMDLPEIRHARARMLVNRGYRKVQDVAEASPDDLMQCLDHLTRDKAMRIIDAAKAICREAADEILDQAAAMLGGSLESIA